MFFVWEGFLGFSCSFLGVLLFFVGFSGFLLFCLLQFSFSFLGDFGVPPKGGKLTFGVLHRLKKHFFGVVGVQLFLFLKKRLI